MPVYDRLVIAKAIKKLFVYSNMVEKKQLNVRIPFELQERIENDGRSKVDIVVEALELYFDSKNHNDASKNDISSDSNASKNDVPVNSNDSKQDTSANCNDSNNDNSISKFEQVDSNGIAGMKNEIEYLRSKVDDLIKLLHQEQVLHIQTQHMLTTPQVMKKWWQFWL